MQSSQSLDVRDILVSCTNDRRHGGIYILRQGSAWERVYQMSCMGIASYEGHYIVASQSVGNAKQDGPSSGNSPPVNGLTPHSIVCLDGNFRVLTEAPVGFLGMGDLHDAVVKDDELFVVDTYGNRVVVFGIGTLPAPDSLPLGPFFIYPLRQWIYESAAEPDACHVNSLVFLRGRVLVSIFGPFERHREYENRRLHGQIIDITEGFRSFGDSRPSPPAPIVADGLADPHSLVEHEGQLMLAESRKNRILVNRTAAISLSDGYLRGLLPVAGGFWIGVSKSRHALNDTSQTAILFWDLAHEAVTRRVALPAREIYDIAPAL